MPRIALIQVRRGTAAEWTAANPILNNGEPAFEEDTNKFKVGNGSDDWVTLPYLVGGAGSAVWGAIVGTLSDQTDLQAALNAKTPTSRTISTTAPLAGGGNLSANRTLTITAATTSAQGSVELATDGETAANVAVQGNDSRLSNSRVPNGAAGGDLTGTYPNPTITTDAVTFPKMQNIATDRLVGRDTAGSGDPEEISLNASLEFSGSSSIQRAALTGDVTASAGSNATTIANDVVTFAKVQNVAANSVPARAASSSGDLSEVALAASQILGRGSSGDIAAIMLGTGLSMSGATLSANGVGDIAAIEYVIDGSGATITTGIKGPGLEIPFACTINRVTLLADQSGSIVVDVWKDTYANYPPTGADSITASAKPTITTATKSQDSTLTGWTTSIAAGDILRFNVDSVTTIQSVTLSLKVTKT